jgi:hypothetical protein
VTSSVSATGGSAGRLASCLISRTVGVRQSPPGFASARGGCGTSALYGNRQDRPVALTVPIRREEPPIGNRIVDLLLTMGRTFNTLTWQNITRLVDLGAYWA